MKKNHQKRQNKCSIEKALKVLIIVGIISVIFQISPFYFMNTATGTVIDIQARNKGMEYQSVNVGGESPCIIEVEYKDSEGVKKIGKTNEEFLPCSKSLSPYYNITDKVFNPYYSLGDRVYILYSEDGLYIDIYPFIIEQVLVMIITLIVLPGLIILFLKKRERTSP